MSDSLSLNLLNTQLRMDSASNLSGKRPELSEEKLDNASSILNEQATSDGLEGLNRDEFQAATAEMKKRGISDAADFLEKHNQAWLEQSAQDPEAEQFSRSLRLDTGPDSDVPEKPYDVKGKLEKFGVKNDSGEYVVSDEEAFNVKNHIKVDLGLVGSVDDVKIQTDFGSAIDDDQNVKFSFKGTEYSAKLDSDGKFIDMKPIEPKNEDTTEEGSAKYKLTHIDGGSFKVKDETVGYRGITQANGSFKSSGEVLSFSYTDNHLRVTDSKGTITHFTDKEIKEELPDFAKTLVNTKPDKKNLTR